MDKLISVASRRLGLARVEVVVGSLADPLGVEAVVHPTSASMGLDGAVGAALAAKMDAQAFEAARSKLPPMEVAEARVTPSFGLPSSNLIHCRGPRRTDADAVETLARTYWNVFSLAEETGFPSLAFPVVSAGGKGFPLEEAIRVAVEELKSFSPDFGKVRLVRFVCPTRAAADVFAGELLRPPNLPKEIARLDLPMLYSKAEVEALRRGFFGDQDTKWFFYHEEPWLLVYRGNREFGSCQFWLRLPDGTSPAPIAEAFMKGGSESPWGSTVEVRKLLEYLLDDRFGLFRVAASAAVSETVGSASFRIWRDKVALESSASSEDEMLSADQARALGVRLVELADLIDRMEPKKCRRPDAQCKDGLWRFSATSRRGRLVGEWMGCWRTCAPSLKGHWHDDGDSDAAAAVGH